MISNKNRKDRLSSPLMHAFRSAHAARDATKKIDVRDESGERIISGRRTVGRTPITENLLRREVARDLEALMNTVAFESAEDLREHPYVRKSILNFGLPDIVHRTIDEVTVSDVKSEIESILTNFEPRLVRDTVHAARDNSIDPTELKVRFVVQADLRCIPVDVPVEFVADMDLDGNAFQINRL
jgi:type VI secretion system protein ImpF